MVSDIRCLPKLFCPLKLLVVSVLQFPNVVWARAHDERVVRAFVLILVQGFSFCGEDGSRNS